MRKLTKKQIVQLNRMTIAENGGQFIEPNNFLNGEQLDYVVEMIDAEMFGQDLYPTIADRAAVYMFSIISNHIFSDGNKRTGLTAALTFLHVNGYQLKDDFVPVLLTTNSILPVEGDYDKDLENFTLAVASAQVNLEGCRKWFADNLIQR